MTCRFVRMDPSSLTTTPVPTPQAVGITAVGLFEGARYQNAGIYRPVDVACLMHFLEQPFCPVCNEGMIRGFYGVADPVDAAKPAAGAGSSAKA